MTYRRRVDPRRVRLKDVPDKPALALSETADIGADTTLSPYADIPEPKALRFSSGTNPYFADDETADTPRIYAQVNLPSASSLSVDLVRSDLVYQLEEYRTDQGRVAACFWLFVGAIINIVINWVTSSPMTLTPISETFLVIFCVLALLCSVFMISFGTRASKKSEEIAKSRTSLVRED